MKFKILKKLELAEKKKKKKIRDIEILLREIRSFKKRAFKIEKETLRHFAAS